jgi:hypothetical protein
MENQKSKVRNFKKNQWTDIKIQVKAIDMVKSVISDLVREERKNAFACERNRIDELDKAMCQMQKTLRSFEVKLNRIEAGQK